MRVRKLRNVRIAEGVQTQEIATGQVTGICQDRHRHQEFLRFLKHVARAYPDQELHLVMDNYAAHKRIEVRDWWPKIPVSMCTSPRPPRRGSTLSKSGSASSNARPSGVFPVNESNWF